MRNRWLPVLGLVVASVVSSRPLLAHHGAAGYDNSKQTTVKATITDFIWANPHCEVKFDATDDKGTVQHWTIEAPPPTMLVERGWTRRSLKAGDVVTIYLNAAKNGSTSGIMRKAVLANGEDLWAYPPPDILEKLTTPQK
jgi:Family of unknown function (DUF6152)